jgi:hypothetical protein
MSLTFEDYKKILQFYNMSIPKSREKLRQKAETMLLTKLCKCIKKVDRRNENRSIPICTKSVIQTKGYNRGKFSCRAPRTIQLTKRSPRPHMKTVKKLKKYIRTKRIRK